MTLNLRKEDNLEENTDPTEEKNMQICALEKERKEL